MNQKSFGFIPWLIFFFLALISIPFFIWFDLLGAAKFVGIAVTVSLVIVLRIWLYRLGKLGKPPRVSLNANDVFELKRLIPALDSISAAEQLAFQHRIGLLMSKITVQQEVSLSPINSSPKSLAMLGATLFLLNGLETQEELIFVLGENTTLKLTDNQLFISLEGAIEIISGYTPDQIVLAIAP
jgi:hypothetical protein